MIPENVHTIPQVASWNSEGEQGFLDWKCSEGMRGNAVWNSNGMGGKCVCEEGGFCSEFPDGEDGLKSLI